MKYIIFLIVSGVFPLGEKKRDMMKHQVIATILLFFLLSFLQFIRKIYFQERTCSNSASNQYSNPDAHEYSIANPDRKNRPPMALIMASALEGNLTKSGLVFNVVSRNNSGLNFRTTECFEGSVGYGYVTYTIDGSSCFYVPFDTKDFPLNNPIEQFGDVYGNH